MLYAAWFLGDGAVYQHAQKAEFFRPTVAEVAPPAILETATLVSPPEGDPGLIGELKIANVDLDVMVGEGLDKQTLRRAAGHPEWSAKPGEQGNLVLLGHRDTFFRPLRRLKRGDVAEIRTKTGVFRYRIHRIKIVAPEDVDVAQNKDHAELTLVTCYPFYFVGPSPRRFVAQGRLIEEQGN
jgi:sortase A